MNASKMMLGAVACAVTLSVCACDASMRGQVRERPVVLEQRPVYVEQRPVYVEPRPVYVEPRRELIVEPAPAPLIDVHIH